MTKDVFQESVCRETGVLSGRYDLSDTQGALHKLNPNQAIENTRAAGGQKRIGDSPEDSGDGIKTDLKINSPDTHSLTSSS